jgi:hypothetical protein
VNDNQTRERDDHETAAGFRLRPERPRVMRLSRKVLAGLAGAASLAILGALIWALDTSRRSQQSGQELFNTDNKTTPDGLASLPKDSIPGAISAVRNGLHRARPSDLRTELSFSTILCVVDFRCIYRADIIQAWISTSARAAPTKSMTPHHSLIAE